MRYIQCVKAENRAEPARQDKTEPRRKGRQGQPDLVPSLPCSLLALPSYTGRRSSASQPGSGVRFSRVRVPPWASAIWRERARPMPVPPGFVV
jgi:hypothetical protein